MNNALLILSALIIVSCSTLKPAPPVLVEVPIETVGPVINRSYALDEATQDARFAEDAAECNRIAAQTGQNPKDCLTLKQWENIR